MRLHHLIPAPGLPRSPPCSPRSPCPFSRRTDSRNSRFRLQQAAAQAAAQPRAESVRRLSIDEAVTHGDGAEPRDSDSAVRPADSGYERGSGTIVLGAEPVRPASTGTRKRCSRRTRLPGAARARSTSRSSIRWSSTRRCRTGAQYTRPPGTTRGRPRRTSPRSFIPQARFGSQPAILAAADAQLRNRSDSPAGGQQQEERASSPTFSWAVSSLQTLRASRTRTGICPMRSANLKAQQAVAGAVAAVAEGQPEARRDRHHGADRHRAGAGRSREQ